MMFETVGEKPRWALALEVLQAHVVGDVIEYDEFGEILETTDRTVIQAAARDAGRRFLRENSNAIEPVRGRGYRIVAPDEHVRLARSQQKRSTRALRRGHQTIAHTDFNGMDPDNRKLAEAMILAFSAQLEFNRRMDVRQKKLAAAVAAVEDRQERSDDEVEKLKSRLAALEERLGSDG